MTLRIVFLVCMMLGIAVPGSSYPIAQTPVPNNTVIDLTIAEPSGLTGNGEPVTSGVPIPLTATQSQWALFDGQTEIPLQTKLLSGIRTPWLLLDFQSSLTANETHTYTLKEQASTASPLQPISINETATSSTVITGPIKAVIGKTTFNLFDELWIDRSGNGTFEPGEQVIFPTANDNLPLREGTTSGTVQGALITGRGTPTQYVWETTGSLRSTLKVEGVYGDPSAPLLRYTTRITFYTGRADVTVEHVLRNSIATEERYVKVQSAKLIAGGTNAGIRATKSGSYLWSNVVSTGTAIETIPPTLGISTQYDPTADPYVVRQNATIDVDQNGGMLIGDWSYHGVTARLDFSEDLTPAQKTEAAVRAGDRLVALASAEWYSDRGAFGAEHFGTLDEEKATYQRWGWQWPTPGNLPYSNEPYIGRVKNAFRIDWNTFDAGDFEADDVWMNLLMYVRTRSRGYLDRADAMARYWKWEYTWRSDGFHYNRPEFWSGPARPTVFPRVDLPVNSFTADDTKYVDYNIKYYGKNDGNHSWNAGLIDYYYLFGDEDALAAAVDTAEQSQQHSYWRIPGSSNARLGGNVRGEGRQLFNTLRVYEATLTDSWLSAATHIRDLFMATPLWDTRGFYYGETNGTTLNNVNLRYPNAKYFSAFMLGVVNQAFYRYWIITGDEAVRGRIISMADFAVTSGHGPEGYTGDTTVIDWPTPGNIIHMTYDEFRNDNPTYHYVYATSSNSFINTLVIAYRFTGNQTYLSKAKFYWEKSSKRRGTNPYDQLTADGSHVGRFMNSLDNWNEWSTLFPSNGDLPDVHLLFYDALRVDETAPDAILNLATS